MESRIERNKDIDNNDVLSRTEKNKQLYNNINNEELNDFTINANASILTDNAYNINIAQVRDMLDKKYRDNEIKNVITVPEIENDTENEYEKTREYDINEILNKARSKSVNPDYNEERLKKLRNTQFDILKNLDVKKEEEIVEPESMGLMELINTITEKELTHTEVDPLDILSDLKGNDETKIINTININEVSAPQIDTTVNTPKLSDSIEFNKNDFDEFDDLKNESGSRKIIINTLLIFLLIGFLGGLFVLLNYLLNWGLF